MIYLLRHGLDDEEHIGGWSDLELLPEGIKQVNDAADFIKNANIKIDTIYSSDIMRAKQSAEIVKEKINKEIILMSELRELDKGDVTGLKKEIADEKFSHALPVTEVDQRYPNGESMLDFFERIKTHLPEILKLNNSLIVTHRGVINMIYFILNDMAVDLDKKQFEVNHGTVHELDPINMTIRKIY